MSKLKLAIVVMSRSPAEDNFRLYEDLVKQTFENFKLFILDDNSPDGSYEKMKQIEDEKFAVHKYMSPYKFGYDKKWNFILRIVLNESPEYIYTIHNDMKINNNNLLEELVYFMDKHPNYGAVAPTIYNGKGIMTWGPGIKKIRMGKEYIMNETYLVRAKCFLEMGLINEKLIYYGTEYYTFNWLRDNNYKTEILGDVSVTHFASSTPHNDFKNHSVHYQNEKDYYRPRTSILIMKLFCKNDPFYRKIKYFYQELSEPRLKMKRFLKNLQILNFFKTLIILFMGTVVGLFLSIELNKPYAPNE